jgi:hypothetical protein
MEGSHNIIIYINTYSYFHGAALQEPKIPVSNEETRQILKLVVCILLRVLGQVQGLFKPVLR